MAGRTRVQSKPDMPNKYGGAGTFQDGKLARVEIVFDGLAELLPSLEQKYGNPTSTTTEPFQNAYGAKFDAGRAFWQMREGTQILAIERIEFGSSGYYRATNVVFLSEEEVQRSAKAGAPLPNPFDR